MRQLFSAEGKRQLRAAWLLLAASLLAGAGIVSGSHWLLEREKIDSVGSNQRLHEARARVETVRRERDSLQESAEVFRTLLERGLMQSERRLDLVELVNELRGRFALFGLDYEISPQRALALSGGRAFPSVDVLASRVKIRIRALHEGDVVGFIDSISRSQQGFYPVDRCVLRRVDVAAEGLQPRIEAECTLEWITLKEKRNA